MPNAFNPWPHKGGFAAHALTSSSATAGRSICDRPIVRGSAPFPGLIQNAGVMADQGVGHGRCFAPEPLLQPTAEAMPEIPRPLLDKSFREIDSAVLSFRFGSPDHRHQFPRF